MTETVDSIEFLADVCGKLYDVIEKNMLADGGKMKMPRDVFVGSIKGAPDEVHLGPVKDASNKDFFEYVYREIFSDDAVPGVYAYWKPFIDSMPREEFRRKFLDAAEDSLISCGRKVSIVD